MRETKVLMMPSPPTSGSVGSTTKSIGIAKILKEKGCDVRFVMSGKLGKLIQDNNFYSYPAPQPVHKTDVSEINSFTDFIRWSGMSDYTYIEEAVKSEIKAMEDFQPDVIFAETRPTATISSKFMNISSIMVASWPCAPEFEANKNRVSEIQGFNNVLKKYNQPLVKSETELIFSRADVKLAPTLPELEPDLLNMEGVRYVGYMLDLEEKQTIFEFENKDYPLIFIYLSVSAISPHIYQQIINETFRNEKYNVICALGYHYNGGCKESNLTNIKYFDYVSVASIIKKTDLVIFHGGQDTMMTCLLNGVPSIVIPGRHFERAFNASQIEKAKAAKVLPVYAFRPGKLNLVVKEVLSGKYKYYSQVMSQKLKNYGGTQQCADIIIETANR
ncbi:MAG: hypothetical protein K2M78_09705 [Lachnospiraceae bacterium]|nr:hypothetical protein [Lachnospiraceae bacterium]